VVITSHASTMALLTALALALLLMISALTAWPVLAAAADAGSATSALAGNPPPPPSQEARSSRLDTPKPAPLPKRGKASNPYDMEALQNFDAGSHR
jgi:hypothetical protein